MSRLNQRDGEVSVYEISEACRSYHTPVGMKMAMAPIIEKKIPYYGVIKENGAYRLMYAELCEYEDIIHATMLMSMLRSVVFKESSRSECSLTSEQVLALVGFGRGYTLLIDEDEDLCEIYMLSYQQEFEYDQYTCVCLMAEERTTSRFYQMENCACADAKEIPMKDLFARRPLDFT